MSASDLAVADDARAQVGALPVLQLLPDTLRELVVESFEERSFAFGESIVIAGEAAEAFFVLVDGLARVLAVDVDGDEVPLAILRPGDSFGEQALADEGRHRATVRASGPTRVARLDRSILKALTRLYPKVGQVFEMQSRAKRLQGFLKLDAAFSVLGPEGVATMLRDVTERRIPAGGLIAGAGETSDRWWVVESGRLTVFSEGGGRRKDIRFLRTGDLLGELALLRGGPRTASVEATSDAVLLELTSASFRELLRDHDAFRARIEERRKLYERGPALRPLDFTPTAQLAEETGLSAPGADEATAGWVLAGAELSDAPVEAGEWIRPRRFPFVRQIDEIDCGAACVAMLCRAFGHAVSAPFIRQAVGTGQDGTSLRGILHGSEIVGLEARAIKASKDQLAGLPMPCIIHWEGNHWVVVYAVDNRRARIADPARGLRRVGLDEVREKWSGYTATARPTPELLNAPPARTDIRWLLPFIRPVRGQVALAAVLAVAAMAGQLAPPILTQRVIDALLRHQGTGRVTAIIGAMVVLLLLSLGISMVQRRFLARVAVQLDGATLDFIAGRLLRLPLSYFHSRRTADIERRLNGLRTVRQLLVEDLVNAFTGALQLLATIVIMFVYSWVIGLAFLATAPIYALLMRFSAQRLRPTFDGLEEAYARHGARQLDAIKGIEAVKSAGAEAGVQHGIRTEFRRLAHRVFMGDFVAMVYSGAVQLATFGIFVLFLWIGALLVISGQLTVGQLVSTNALVLLANGPIVILLQMWDRVQHTSVLLARLQDVLEHPPEQPEATASLRSVPALSGQISLRRLSFAYPDTGRPVLREISLQLEPGMTLGLVGRSGSGKSSLVKCLAGLFIPSSGAIFYDGVDLQTLRWVELRRHIGLVLQEPYLFDDTITANIALGESAADPESVRRAAEIADAAEFIEALPLGYQTKVGDSGMRLSGGQTQRIAIARALYHEPPVLLFDEATSALDTESERTVKENLDRVLDQRTAVVIAHRLSTVRDADVIGVLEKGHLVELGTHEQLMAREGLYYYLNTVQVAA